MNIFDLFDKAKQTLQWPKLSYPLETGEIIQFSVAGPQAKVPGSINITDGGKPGFNKYYGRIIKEDAKRLMHIDWHPGTNTPIEIKELVRAIIANPIGMCSVTGQQRSYCCFCSTHIQTKESLAVGYGPICAEKWGLPWGQLVLKELDSKNL